MALVGIASLAGCSNQPARVKPPPIDPQAAGRAAIAEYDTNGDGVLDKAELAKSPGLLASLQELDKDADGRVSADEIADRIRQWQVTKIAVMPFLCTVLLDGRPLTNATVTIVPEKFLGPDVLPASGVTSNQGTTALTVPKESLKNPRHTGVHCGFYKIEISKQQGGKELVPARYNVNTELGQEVSQDSRISSAGVMFDLKSK